MNETRTESPDPFDVVAPPARGPKRFRRIERGRTPETGIVETLVIAFFVLVVLGAATSVVIVLVSSMC